MKEKKASELDKTVTEQSADTQLKTPKLKRTKSTESLTGKTINAEEIGLEIYTTKERGWPQNMSNTDLITGIEKKIYKGKYTESRYTEEQIMRKLRKNEINLNNSNCWIVVENESFRKIRAGINAERSPLSARDPRRK